MNDVARRIQRKHNRSLTPFAREGAVLMFTAAGAYIDVWQEHTVAPAYPRGAIPFKLRAGPVSRAEVSAYLDALAGVPRTTADLYGRMHRKPLEEEVVP